MPNHNLSTKQGHKQDDKQMKIALGPLQYYWPRHDTLNFYAEACDWPVDIVYVGETVCSRRHELRLDDWLEIAHTLKEAGKTVVLSTQVLLESRVELRTLGQITAQQDFLVEANDMGAVKQMQGRPFVAGPFLNLYSPPSLAVLAQQGAQRWVMPLEMGRAGLQAMLDAQPQGLETEVFAYGRMPLAFSARCFSARNQNLPKDNCHYVCLEHPDGLLLETREGEAFLTINGIQTQSATVYSLLAELPELQQMGVEVLRLSPQSQHMSEIVQTFADVLSGKSDATAAQEALTALMPAAASNGYWHGRAGKDYTAQVSGAPL